MPEHECGRGAMRKGEFRGVQEGAMSTKLIALCESADREPGLRGWKNDSGSLRVSQRTAGHTRDMSMGRAAVGFGK